MRFVQHPPVALSLIKTATFLVSRLRIKSESKLNAETEFTCTKNNKARSNCFIRQSYLKYLAVAKFKTVDNTFGMKQLLKLIVSIISVLLLSLSLSWGDDFQKAYDAYKKGDYAIAFKGFKKLAEQGIAKAQFNLGEMYNQGIGVPQDYKEAFRWHKLAAEQGIANAQNNVGNMYRKGHGVPKDYKEAIRWYTLAAEQGNAHAQYGLGFMYVKGQGVIQDQVYAHMWWNISASTGFVTARKNKEKLASVMTPSQIEKAQDLARECVKKNYKGC